MHHVVIMRKSWRLLPKILSGEKTIESRWYKTRCEAWDKVKSGDTVYFKDSGALVSLKGKVSKVLQFENLKPETIKWIVKKYGKKIGSNDLGGFYQWVKNKKYCVLIFLKNSQKIKPFKIDKTGFGSARAFLTVKNIEKIRMPEARLFS